MKNYLTYRVASSLTLALFFLISACAFNPQARSLVITPVVARYLVITPVVALFFLVSACAFNFPQVSRDPRKETSLYLSTTLTLVLVKYWCAFNPQDYLGCYIQNATLVNGSMVGGFLPPHLNGTVCEILNYR